jgi:hypothetical protein
MIFVFNFALLLGNQTTRAGGKGTSINSRDVAAMGTGLSCLFGAWLYDRFQHRRGHGSRERRVRPEGMKL